MTSTTVAIVGAGPYGLAAAAHLRSAGVPVRVFGEAMEFWQRQMPAGMLLRSSWDASHISDPKQALTLDAYQIAKRIGISTPVLLSDFVEYGRWFQNQAVPDLDCRRVALIEPVTDGFRIDLADGDTIQSQRVVIATGLSRFAYRPTAFAGLPQRLVSHAADEIDLGRYAREKVVVVGGGQSAVESAALLREGGADVELIIRSAGIRWLGRTSRLRSLSATRRLLYHPTDVGPPGLSQIVAHPDLFRRLPRALQDTWADRAIRPAAAAWLRPRVIQIRQTTARSITSVTPRGSGVQLTLDDGTRRYADHVVLATGYRVDILQHPLLSPILQRSLHTLDGYPRLTEGFETTVPGLHFLGAPAAKSFGPLMRFVSGTDYSGHALTRRILSDSPVRIGELAKST